MKIIRPFKTLYKLFEYNVMYAYLWFTFNNNDLVTTIQNIMFYYELLYYSYSVFQQIKVYLLDAFFFFYINKYFYNY